MKKVQKEVEDILQEIEIEEDNFSPFFMLQ